MAAFKDITGQRFGLLTAARFIGRNAKKHSSEWELRCDCGAIVIKDRGNLLAGRVKSCGASKHRPKTRPAYKNASRGPHPLQRVWGAMIQRCTNPNAPDYHLYGGRGITVCERWRKFKNFVADVGKRPSPKHSLDRYPNKNGNYEPGNVRWATPIEQANNTRRNRMLTAFGKTQTMAQWAREAGLTQDALEQRIRTLQWPIEKALTTPQRRWLAR